MMHLSRRTFLATAALSLTSRPLRAGEQRRIVSVGGAVTEVLYRLGLDSEIVGVNSTSQYPAEALQTKANIGYVRALGAEGILSLAPSLVIAGEGAGPTDALRLIEQAGVPIVQITDAPSAEGVMTRIREIAQAVDASERGAMLAREVEQEFAALSDLRQRAGKPVRALFVLSLQNGRPLVGGSGTTADAMLTLAGASNAAAAIAGWKPLSDEGLITSAPEAIIMMRQGPGGAAQDPFALPSFGGTPAAATRNLIVMDGLYLLGFGPRTPAAARDLMLALNPQSQTSQATRTP